MIRLALAAALFAVSAEAQDVRVAVAANFLETAEDLTAAWEGGEAEVVHGSTGRLYAQIVAGAPFDVFLAADAERPARLLAEGIALDTATYALGRLTLVAPGLCAIAGEEPDGAERALCAAKGDDAAADRAALATGILARAGRLALADPAVAPYGRAAVEALDALAVPDWREKAVFGENVGQTFAFWATGNVPAALVASSQAASGLELPGTLHAPIRQDAALVSDDPMAAAFFDWLGSQAAREIIADAGYGLPE